MKRLFQVRASLVFNTAASCPRSLARVDAYHIYQPAVLHTMVDKVPRSNTLIFLKRLRMHCRIVLSK